jgi:lysophospholipase L1-like esterase
MPNTPLQEDDRFVLGGDRRSGHSKFGVQSKGRPMIMNRLVHIGRMAYRLILGFCSLGVGFWLLRNLVAGNLFGQWEYFLPAVVILLAMGGIIYLFAFRLKDHIFINLNLSLAAIILALVSSEITIRVWDHYDPILLPEYLRDDIKYARKDERAVSPYRPGSTGATNGHPVRINNLGFRGPEVSQQKPRGRLRVLVLGDSFTFGQGIAEEEIYTSVLERRLRAQFPGRDIEVVNVGIQGASTVQEADLLFRIGPVLDPDLLLIGFVGNDPVQSYPPLPWQVPISSRLKGFLISHLRLFELINDRYDKLLLKWGVRLGDLGASIPSYNQESQDWKDFVRAYQRILEWTKARQIPVPVVGLFLSGRDNSDFINLNLNMRIFLANMRQVAETLNAMGIRTIDYTPYFQRHNNENFAVSKWEGHPNALAHKLYAEGFLDSIEALVLIR